MTTLSDYTFTFFHQAGLAFNSFLVFRWWDDKKGGASQMALVLRDPHVNVGEDVRDARWIPGLIPGLEIFLGGEHGHTLHYFCLENPTDRGAWRATVQRVTELGGLTEAPWHIKKGTNNTGFKWLVHS